MIVAPEAVIPCGKMPASIVGRALFWAANTNFLNPPNDNQTLIDKAFGKPFRCVARLIYQIFISIFVGLYGTFYHLLAAASYKIGASIVQGGVKKERASLAWEHLKAAGEDFNSMIIFLNCFCISPHSSVSAYFSSNRVTVIEPTNRNAHPEIIKKLEAEAKQKEKTICQTQVASFSFSIFSQYRYNELILCALEVRELTHERHLLTDEIVLHLANLRAWVGTNERKR